ncbi:U32 family peptidase [Candidatus Methanocrinis natronophilus]|uniref:U32 family peptidase n=1 Tax=Candidatus Methanocrinis natronophilus TaxID=3033396 RepID=A0ABT5X7N1_9EURY|nr:U32 family peptidase [Candidatus Methanocrinis natronophilus]MDF0590705.1 U32 family peptidase [Candidatus Methanocrinis natronophilus]
MRRSREVPELLAPAGSWDGLLAALDAGADAVYLAGKRFGARRGAENFDDQQLAKAIDLAHLRGVRVYVAVNTLIPEAEVGEVAERLLALYGMGADAVLVQDLGVLRLARDIVPDLELHASTQMTISTLEGARWCAEMGLSRAVLARELTLPEVVEIGEKASIGVEVFVHGALCYSYSGQCLLSSAIGGRSGNRGLCAQPCRKPYSLMRAKERDPWGRPLGLEEVPLPGRYLLSSKDLACYPNLQELAKAPIEAVKIEGRMRSPEYVRAVVSIYRRALDAISRFDWAPSARDYRDLALAFNRSFTPGWIGGARRGEIVSCERPDNRGLRIGHVVSWDRRRKAASVRIEGELVPERGDGLVISSRDKEVGTVARSPVLLEEGLISLPSSEPVERGAIVYITRRASLGGGPGTPGKPIPIDLEVRWDGMTPALRGEVFLPDGKVVSSIMEADFSMEAAKKRPLSQDDIKAQLFKAGGTPFFVRKIEMDYPGGLFAPLGVVNRLRREFLKLAEEDVASSFRPAEEMVMRARAKLEGLMDERRPSARTPVLTGSRPSVSVYADSLPAVAGACEGGCRRVYFEPAVAIAGERRCKPEAFAPTDLLEILALAKEICDAGGADLVWKWPRIARRSFLDFAAPLLKRAEVEEVMVEGFGLAEAVAAVAPEMRVSGSFGLNIWNSIAVEALSARFSRLALSPELSAPEVEELVVRSRLIPNRPDLEVLVQGNVEAMVAEDCLLSSALGCDEAATSGADFWGIRDETGRVFPVRRDGECRTRVYNAVELSLVDQVPALADMGVSSIAVDARGRTRDYARRMAEIFGEAVGGGDLSRLKGQAMEISLGGTTGGAFLRGRREGPL